MSRSGGAGEDPAVAVHLSDAHVSFDGTKTILRGINLRVHRGEHVAVVGLSGSGKTTLLRSIAGKIPVSIGEVSVFGRVAMIHQDLRLVSQASVHENVCHGSIAQLSTLRSFFGFPKETRKKAEEFIADVGLLHRKDTPVYRLSGGEKQRVAIARALMSAPDVLLADEPVASLDEVNASAIMRLLKDLNERRHLTVISVLHQEQLAKRFTDRVIVLNQGAIAIHELPTTLSECTSLCGTSSYCTTCPVAAVAGGSDSPVSPLQFVLWAALAVLVYGWAFSGISISERSMEGATGRLFGFLIDLFPTSLEDVASIPWGTLWSALLETFKIALLGTTFGTLLSFPLAALAIDSKRTSLVRSTLRRMVRSLLNVIRSVPSLIWALLFTASVGFGPLAGVLALTVYSVGYLSKFFYEAFEGVDPRTPEALREFGATGLQRFQYAVWPAAMPGVLSSFAFMLEYNVRAATILGVVDAGGIGFYIKQYIDFRFFPAVTASLLMILCVVFALDFLSQKMRAKLVTRS